MQRHDVEGGQKRTRQSIVGEEGAVRTRRSTYCLYTLNIFLYLTHE